MARKIRRLPFAVRVAYAMDAVPEAAKANLNGGSLMMAINAVEAQRNNIDPRTLGLDIDKDSTVEEIVARFCPECDDATAASVTELLTKLKGTPDTVEIKTDEEPEDVMEETKEEEIAEEMPAEETIEDEDPEETEAFAEGVDYGEEKEKEEPEHLDRLHESEGMEKYEEEQEAPTTDEDKDAKIDAILASLPDLDDEKKAALADALKDLAYSTATGEDEEPEEMPVEEIEENTDKEEEMVAHDCGTRRRGVAMDAASIKRRVRAEMMADFKARSRAANQTRHILGNIDVMAYDSANSIYADALKKVGINVRAYPSSAYPAMYAAYNANRNNARAVAQDAKPVDYSGAFAHLKNIKIGD